MTDLEWAKLDELVLMAVPFGKADMLEEMLQFMPDDASARIRHGSFNNIFNEDAVEALVALKKCATSEQCPLRIQKRLSMQKRLKILRRQSDGSSDWGLGISGMLKKGMPQHFEALAQAM